MLKTPSKFLLKHYLKFWAKLALLLYRPRVVAVAGSVNKHFFKTAIARQLEELGYSARFSPRNFNTEIGLPLAVLDLESGYNSYRHWLPLVLRAPARAFMPLPDFLVLEMGTDRAGDMKYLLSIVRPRISVITDITQRHLEGYRDMDELAAEYSQLARKTQKNGLVILNRDNPRVISLSKQAQARVKTFSCQSRADARAENIRIGESGHEFEIHGDKQIIRTGRFGKHHIQAHLAARLINDHVAKQKK